MKKCPYCDEEIQDKAIVCRYCGRDIDKILLSSPKSVGIEPAKETITTTNQGPSFGFIFGYVFLLELFTYLALFALPFTYFIRDGIWGFSTGVIFAIVFYIIFRTTIGVWGARGENPSKTTYTDYVLYIFFSYIPVLGIISSIRAAKYLWYKQNKRVNNKSIQTQYLAILGGVVLLFIGLYIVNAINHNEETGILPNYPTVSIAKTPTHITTIHKPLKNSVSCNPYFQECLPGAPTPSLSPDWRNLQFNSVSTCTLWSDISLTDVGKVMCVWGIVESKYLDFNEPNVEYVMYITFGNSSGSFYILSYDYDFPDLKSGDCVKVTADIQQIGKSPVIAINQEDDIFLCNK